MEKIDLCVYCGNPRPDRESWHDCPLAQDAKARQDKTIADLIRTAERKPHAKS